MQLSLNLVVVLLLAVLYIPNHNRSQGKGRICFLVYQKLNFHHKVFQRNVLVHIEEIFCSLLDEVDEH